MSVFPAQALVSETSTVLLGEQSTPLSKEAQFLAAIIQSTEEAIIGETVEGIIAHWNPGAEKMFGFTRSEALGQSISILSSPEKTEEFVRILELIRQGKSTAPFETIRCRKNGSRIHVSISLSPIRNESGQILGAVKIVRDITDLRHSESLLRKTEKLGIAKRLAASVAHEINNPLAALTNLIYLLKSERLPETAAQIVMMAERELSRISHITKQVLGFYQEKASPEEHDLTSILDNALSLHQHRIEATRIDVKKKYSTDVVIVCHAGELRQVFVNLIGNAIDAMSGSGILNLRVRPAVNPRMPLKGVRVTIADSGRGISPNALLHLFEPFFSTKETGTGLGLWMCEQIVSRHQGYIRIRSSQLLNWRGTVVSIFLPLA